jgi:hypothetical protein
MKTRSNVEMCDLYLLRKRNAMKADRISELEKMLGRCIREIETMQAQLNDKQSEMLLSKCRNVLDNKVKELY